MINDPSDTIRLHQYLHTSTEFLSYSLSSCSISIREELLAVPGLTKDVLDGEQSMESRDIPCPALLYVSANPFPAGFSASIAAYFTWISPHQPIVPQHLFTFRYQNYLNSQLQPSPSLPIDLRETSDSYDLPISDLLLLAIAIAGSGALTPSSPAYPSKFQLQLQLGLVFRERISRDKGEILSFEVIKEQPGL